MKDVLKTLLESDVLDENLKTQLKEAWDTKLKETREEMREELETEVRTDLSRRYESDRAKMVEAMDKFITQSVDKELREFNDDRQQVYATRAKLSKQIRENKENHSALVQHSAKALEGFILNKVKDELKEFMTDKRELVLEKRQGAKKLVEHRDALNKVTAGRINKLEKFIVKKLSEEIGEFETDKKLLVEQKVTMARQAKIKLDETRRAFVSRSAGLVEKTLRESLKKEFTQFRDDIKKARENHFGRKVFEAFVAEYMTSYLSEGSEVKKVQVKLDETKLITVKALKRLDTQKELIRTLNNQVKVSEDKAKRGKIMTELLTPLNGENKEVMKIVLNNVKTEKLHEAFKKHLSSVLNENRIDTKKRTLKESRTQRKVVALTGDRKIQKPVKATGSEDSTKATAEVVRLQALAGIK